MRNKLIKIIFVIIILLSSVLIYIFFISHKLKERNLYFVCKKQNVINIELVDTFRYISKYEIKKTHSDSLYIDIYTTTIANFLNRERDISLSIKNNDQHYLFINGIKYKVNNCK